jgi:hypothetical protein
VERIVPFKYNGTEQFVPQIVVRGVMKEVETLWNGSSSW